MFGGVTMREAQIYIIKHKETEKITLESRVSSLNCGGGALYLLGGGGVKISLVPFLSSMFPPTQITADISILKMSLSLIVGLWTKYILVNILFSQRKPNH